MENHAQNFDDEVQQEAQDKLEEKDANMGILMDKKYEGCMVFGYPCIYWFVYFGMFMCGGAVGTVVQVVEATLYLKCAWRYYAWFFCMIPFCIYSYKTQKDCFKNTTISTIKDIFLALLGHMAWFITLETALVYGQTAQVYMFHISAIIPVVIISYFKGIVISKQEKIGIILVFIGGITIVYNSNEVDRQINGEAIVLTPGSIIIGDLIALCGTLGGMWYIEFNALTKGKIPLPFSCLLQALFGGILTSILSLAAESTTTLNFDPDTGVFGFLSMKQFPYQIVVGLVCGVGTLYLYSIASQVFSMLLFTLGLYFEPVAAAILVWVIGMEGFPSKIVCAGAVFLLLPGLMYAAYGEELRKAKIQEELEAEQLIYEEQPNEQEMQENV